MQIKPVQTEAEWELARTIRQRVFVEEQGCSPEEEWDDYDDASRHLLGLVAGRAVATARWRTVADDERLVAKLERFAVLPAHRGRGHGRALVLYAMEDARRAGFHAFLLHAQRYLEAFYASLGFHTISAPFLEAGIEHVKMRRADDALAP